MAFIDAEILKDVIARPASGPAGFGIHYTVKDGADISVGSTSVDTELDERSLQNARAMNEGGANKELSKLNPPKPALGSGLSFIDQKRAHADSMYGSLFAKHGLQKVATQSMETGAGPKRSNHRSALTPEAVAKNPLLRLKQRQMLALRKTFDEIGATKKKSVALNPETLPQTAKDKIIEAAIQKGEKTTLFGELEMTGKVLKTVTSTAVSPWSKWEAVGALASGSFIDLAPRLKRS